MTAGARNNKRMALAEAVRRAAAELAGTDLADRCRRLKLPAPDRDGRLRLRVLGRDAVVAPPAMDIEADDDAGDLHDADRLLLLRYLLCDTDPGPVGEWVSFRRFPGGAFYFGPFRARSIEPMTGAIGNDLAALRRRLGRFDWRQDDPGDLAARIHVLGPVEVMLVYHRGDEEFPPDAAVLFDAAAPRWLTAEDAAALASRICLSMLRED